MERAVGPEIPAARPCFSCHTSHTRHEGWHVVVRFLLSACDAAHPPIIIFVVVSVLNLHTILSRVARAPAAVASRTDHAEEANCCSNFVPKNNISCSRAGQQSELLPLPTPPPPPPPVGN